MALETLKEVEELDGFNILNIDELAAKHPDKWDAEARKFDWDWFKENVYPKGNYIIVDDHKNSITFKIQNGPIKEKGVNGCQVDTLISAAHEIIFNLDRKFPSLYNINALYHLKQAYEALKDRKRDREARGVEGENKE